jgi:hypothetical protein
MPSTEHRSGVTSLLKCVPAPPCLQLLKATCTDQSRRSHRLFVLDTLHRQISGGGRQPLCHHSFQARPPATLHIRLYRLRWISSASDGNPYRLPTQSLRSVRDDWMLGDDRQYMACIHPVSGMGAVACVHWRSLGWWVFRTYGDDTV